MRTEFSSALQKCHMIDGKSYRWLRVIRSCQIDARTDIETFACSHGPSVTVWPVGQRDLCKQVEGDGDNNNYYLYVQEFSSHGC